VKRERMKLERVSLVNCGGFAQLDIEFDSGVTVIAGVNGVGKSTVLNALAAILSRAMPAFTPAGAAPIYFTDDMIHNDKASLEASAQLRLDGQLFNAKVQRVRATEDKPESFILLRQEQRIAETGGFADTLSARTLTGDLDAGSKETQAILAGLKAESNPPLAIYFSPRRQLPGQPRSLPASNIPFEPATAYGRALHEREVELREVMHWFRTQEVLGAQNPQRIKVLDALRSAVTAFMPGFSNLRIQERPRLGFMVDKNGHPFMLHQLSDGERGLLALVFDLTRRLAIANPDSDDPIAEGVALVMIDEIELHLHPKWQRTVVRRLREVFANCQFVITTHSPQVIGQVKAAELRLLHVDEGDRVSLAPVSQSFGMDSSWILQNIMNVPARDYEMEQRLSAIFNAIDDDDYAKARTDAEALRLEIGDFPDLQEALGLLDRLQMLEQNEED
jgi:energy-coupling factor transporter ATP-binding protein EcfA2